MRKLDLRVPAVVGLAVLLLAFAPRAQAAENGLALAGFTSMTPEFEDSARDNNAPMKDIHHSRN